ncbi:hypothetical protein CFP56_033979 [Quercus suber]|uniref:Uncharacterized protein n=1 Tax=Quercus suber TaxID=58331 RepID=A0AAW0JD74_QUESU
MCPKSEPNCQKVLGPLL